MPPPRVIQRYPNAPILLLFRGMSYKDGYPCVFSDTNVENADNDEVFREQL